MTDRQLRLLTLLTALAVVLLAGSCLGAYFVGYHKGSKSVEKQIDTLRIRQKIYIKQPPLLKEVTVPVPTDVDTAAILAAHFAERIYSDTVRVPDVMTVIFTDTVTQNTRGTTSFTTSTCQLSAHLPLMPSRSELPLGKTTTPFLHPIGIRGEAAV